MIIQIAGVKDIKEAIFLADSGVDFLGFPLRLDYHSPDLREDDAKYIIGQVRGRVNCVLITYLTYAKEIVEFCDYLGLRWVQVHGDASVSEMAGLKMLRSRLKVIKSLIVRGDNLEDLYEEVRVYQEYTDYFITDTFDESTGARGATGKTHDWQISRKIVEISQKPVILAGGLKHENVAEAIKIVRPAGVDVHTGVEGPDGRKDIMKVRKFVSEVELAEIAKI